MTLPKGFGSTEKCPKCGKYFWNRSEHVKKCKPSRTKSLISWFFVKKNNQNKCCEEKDE